MNAFSKHGKALPSEVRNEIIEKSLLQISNEGVVNILQQEHELAAKKTVIVRYIFHLSDKTNTTI